MAKREREFKEIAEILQGKSKKINKKDLSSRAVYNLIGPTEPTSVVTEDVLKNFTKTYLSDLSDEELKELATSLEQALDDFQVEGEEVHQLTEEELEEIARKLHSEEFGRRRRSRSKGRRRSRSKGRRRSRSKGRRRSRRKNKCN
jgi:hypothetical protein